MATEGMQVKFFIQSQLERRRDYVVYFYNPQPDPATQDKISKLRKSDPTGDAHAGETETARVMDLRPELVQKDRATQESGADQNRLILPDLYTAIWWYAKFFQIIMPAKGIRLRESSAEYIMKLASKTSSKQFEQ